MSKLTTPHEVSVLGMTKTLTTSGSSQAVELVADPAATAPQTFLVYCNEDVYLRQGDEDVTAGTSDFLLKADNYIKITVSSVADNCLAAIQVSAAGTLRYTEHSTKTPADGTSGAATVL